MRENDDIPDCVPGRNHRWVSGRIAQIDGGGVEIVSRQCRVCGYEDEIPEGSRMRLTPTDEDQRDE